MVFLGGHPTRFMAYAVEELLTWYPFVPVEKTMQVRPRDLCFAPRKPKIVVVSAHPKVCTQAERMSLSGSFRQLYSGV